MEELQKTAINLVENIFKNCDPKLAAFTYSFHSDIKLSAPQVFIDILIEAHKQAFGIWPHRSPEGKLYYRDIEVIPNHEMSIVLFHKEYPKTKESWMIYKIWLETHKLHFQFPDISGIS